MLSLYFHYFKPFIIQNQIPKSLQLLLLTGLNVGLKGRVLLSGEHADDDNVVAVLDELLHLLGCLDLLGRGAGLLTHVVHDAWRREGERRGAETPCDASAKLCARRLWSMTYQTSLWARCSQTLCPA